MRVAVFKYERKVAKTLQGVGDVQWLRVYISMFVQHGIAQRILKHINSAKIEWFNGEENQLIVALINQLESTPLEDLATRLSRVSSWSEPEFAVVD